MLLQGPSAQIENLIYTYDQNGNRTSFTRNAPQTLSPEMSNTSYDEANEMLAFSSKTLTYDNNGNLLTKADSCGTTTYTWDARNRLTNINGFTSTCTSLTASFSYDALGRRISKTINGTTTQFVYDGWDIIQEIKAGVKTNYIRTLNIDEPLTRIQGSTVRHYVTDALGSVMALTDDSGATKTTYVYDAFGNVTITGETSDNPFQFAGRENDGTGLQLDRYRYYSYELLRYISEDPIGLAGGDVNFYIRVGNNPIRFIDPFGFCLTLKQQLIVSLASGTSASIASLAGAGPGVTGAASAITAGLTTAVLGGNLRDVGSNTYSGFISGVTGSYIEKMFLATTTSMKAAVATGTLTGMLEAISLAVDPIFGDTCKDAEKNSCGK